MIELKHTYRKVNDKTNSGAKYAKTQDKVVHAFRYQLKRNLAAILSGIIED